MKIVLKIACIILVIYSIYFPFSYFKKYPDIQTVRVSHILVDTEKEAIDIKNQIEKEGKNFEDLAHKYSKCPSKENGGDLGYNEKERLLPEFTDVAFKLPERKVSEPFKTKVGWHIAKVYRIKYFSDKENFERRYYSSFFNTNDIDKFLNK